MDQQDPYSEVESYPLPFIEITNAFETNNKRNGEYAEGDKVH
jgi:hypothetical protein